MVTTRAARYLERMRRAAGAAGEAGLDALVVAPSADLAYLCGYGPMPLERLTLLILRPAAEPALLVPALERALAAESPVGEAIELRSWADADDPYALAAGLLDGAASIAAGDRMWASHLLGLQAAMPDARFASGEPVIAGLRAVKDEDELAALARVGRAADEAFRRICESRFEGRREEEVAAELAGLLVEGGHATADFTIVASGPNAASPHHEPGGRTILPNDAVVLDFGGQLGGYFSDTSRTVVVGEPPAGFVEVYETVAAAQEAAVSAVRPGVPAEDVDRAARTVIEEAGYGDRFIHRTGHGIGLEVHEPPYIVAGNTQPLAAGTTFSVEPGIYLEGRFGVRIEDIVAVTPEGADRLNRSTRELQVVG